MDIAQNLLWSLLKTIDKQTANGNHQFRPDGQITKNQLDSFLSVMENDEFVDSTEPLDTVENNGLNFAENYLGLVTQVVRVARDETTNESAGQEIANLDHNQQYSLASSVIQKFTELFSGGSNWNIAENNNDGFFLTERLSLEDFNSEAGKSFINEIDSHAEVIKRVNTSTNLEEYPGLLADFITDLKNGISDEQTVSRYENAIWTHLGATEENDLIEITSVPKIIT